MARALLVVAILLLSSLAAQAHASGAGASCAVSAFEVEAYFSDNTAAQGAKVVVYDGTKAVVVEGKTDAEGRWNFARPTAGVYEVVVDAGAGHRATVSLTVPESPATAGATSGPNRAEFTRTPWGPIVAGLAFIGFPAAVLYFWLRKARSATERKS